MSEPENEVPEAPAEEATESTLDSLAADAKQAVAEVPIEYPEGTPEFREVLDLSFRERGPASRMWGRLQAKLKERQKAQAAENNEPEPDEDAESSIDFDDAADMYDMLADIDDFMVMVAVDQAAYLAWDGRKKPDVFIQAFNAYQGATQVPEASSSPS